MEEKDKIASSDAFEDQREYEDRAKRMREENRE